MIKTTNSLALVCANAALTDVICATLETAGNLKLYPLASSSALTTLMRIAPIGLVIFDIESLEGDVPDFLAALRVNPAIVDSHFSAIAMMRQDAWRARRLERAGIAKILDKPVTPLRLLEAVRTNLVPRPARRAAPQVLADRATREPELPHQAIPRPYADNVIPLFGPRRSQM